MKIGLIYEFDERIASIVRKIDEVLTGLGHTVEVDYKHQDTIEEIGWLHPLNLALGNSDGVVAVLTQAGYTSTKYRSTKEELALVTMLAPRPLLITMVDNWLDLASSDIDSACKAVVSRLNWIGEFRDIISQNQFAFTGKALDESITLRIGVQELSEFLGKAYIIDDVPDQNHSPSYLIQGFTVTGRSLHVQCSKSVHPLVKIFRIYTHPVTYFGLFPSSEESGSSVLNVEESFVENKATSLFEVNDKFIIIKNVPARVCLESGEYVFPVETVKRLHQMVWGQQQPSRTIEVPVFEFAP